MTPLLIFEIVMATLLYLVAGSAVTMIFATSRGLNAPVGPHIMVFAFWPLVVALWIIKGVIWTVREPWLQHMRNLWRELAR